MGFFSNLLDKVTPTFTNAISKAANKATKSLLYGDVGSTGSINSEDYSLNMGEAYYENKNYEKVFASPMENKYVWEERRTEGGTQYYVGTEVDIYAEAGEFDSNENKWTFLIWE